MTTAPARVQAGGGKTGQQRQHPPGARTLWAQSQWRGCGGRGRGCLHTQGAPAVVWTQARPDGRPLFLKEPARGPNQAARQCRPAGADSTGSSAEVGTAQRARRWFWRRAGPPGYRWVPRQAPSEPPTHPQPTGPLVPPPVTATPDAPRTRPSRAPAACEALRPGSAAHSKGPLCGAGQGQNVAGPRGSRASTEGLQQDARGARETQSMGLGVPPGEAH